MAGDLLAFLLLFFLVLIALRVPVSYSMLLTSLVYILLSHRMPMSFIPQGMVSGLASYSVMCSPFFIVVGCVMNKAGVTDEIFEFADCLVGHIKGGLGHVNVVASLIFAGMSGSANADAAGLGNIEIKAMTEKGFDRDFAVGITAASSVIGPIFPPSNPMVYVGIMAGVSIGALFLGGIVVGVLMMLFMCITVYAVARKRNYPVRKRATVREICHAFRKGFWALMTPVILIFCIQNGNVTPTEAGAVALVYALFISMFIYKTIKFKDLYGIMAQAINSIGLVLMLVSSGKVFAWALGDQQVAEIVSKGLFSLTTNPWLILLLINLLLLIVGCFMDTTPAMMVLSPILLPIALSIEMNPIHFGVIMVVNLAIGFITPPLGINLFVAARVGREPLETVTSGIMRFMVVMLICLLLITFIPAISMLIPNLFM